MVQAPAYRSSMATSLLLALAPAVIAATPQAAPQAQLHPRDVVLYAELPDMRALLGAYGSAPTAILIRDPEVREAMQALVASAELDLAGMLDQVADSAGIPREMLHAPVQTLHAHLDRASGASVSVSFAEAAPGEFPETLRRLRAVTRELQQIEDALYLHAVDNDNAFPTELNALERIEFSGDVDGTDPWGRPYRYEIEPDGSFRLSSLGADGAPGGSGRDADISAATELDDLLEHEFKERVGVTVAVSFHTADDAKVAARLLSDLATKSPLEPADGSRPAQSSGVDLYWYDAGWGTRANGDPYLWMMRSGNVLSIGGGSSDPKGMLDRISGVTATALDSEGYANLVSRFESRGGATISRSFMNFAELVAALQAIYPTTGVNLSFLTPYARSTWRTGLEEGRFITESYADASGENSMLAQCVAHEPVPEGLWKFIPTEAVGAYATSLDAGMLYEAIFAVLRADLDADEVTKLTKLESDYGFRVAELFGSMGGGMGAYMLPITGLMSLPGIAVVVELENEEVFRSNLEGLLAFLEDQSNGEFAIKSRPYRDQPLWYFSFKSGGPPIPISPSLTIVDGHLLVTLTSTRAKKEIKRVLASLEPDAEPVQLHAVRGVAPEDATMVAFMDWTQLFQGVYDGAKGALALMGGNLELPFDITLLPEAELFTSFYEPSYYWTQLQDGVSYGRAESSFGPETVLGLAGLIGGTAMGVRMQQSGMMPEPVVAEPETAEAEPDPMLPATLARETRDTLKFLATRLAVYRLEAGRYPASLDRLLEATDNYPRGFLDGEPLPVDAWGNGIGYDASLDGGSYRLWSYGPDGADQSGEGDDLVH